jgi:hypothetical protein
VRGGTTARQRSQRYIAAGQVDLRGGQPPERAPTEIGRRSEATNLAGQSDARPTRSCWRVRPGLWEWHRGGACRAREKRLDGFVAHRRVRRKPGEQRNQDESIQAPPRFRSHPGRAHEDARIRCPVG